MQPKAGGFYPGYPDEVPRGGRLCPQAAEDRRLLPGGAEVAALPPLKTFRSECTEA